MQKAAYIVAATRTAVARTTKKGGVLSTTSPVTLGGLILDGLVSKVPSLDPADVDDVVMGCVSQVGPNAGNLGRHCVLASNLPMSVPGSTVDRQCGSGQEAIRIASMAVGSGQCDIVIAGGVESMSVVPMFSNFASSKFGAPLTPSLQKKFNTPGEPYFSQFTAAELMCKTFEITREECDAFAQRSHRLAAASLETRRFRDEITPVRVESGEGGKSALFEVDDGVRGDTTAEGLAGLQTLVEMGVCSAPAGCDPGGVITAGNASQMSDGASALLVCSEEGLKKMGNDVVPMAVIRSNAVAANDPVLMLSAPAPATRMLLDREGLSVDDVDLFEVNEAFACVPLAWEKTVGSDPDKLNVNGGAIALGHPLGATGGKLMTALTYELGRQKKKYGVLAICEGGGTANATLIENLQL